MKRKTCGVCKESKTQDQFHAAQWKNGGYCKECWNTYCRERWIKDSQKPERLRIRRNRHLETKYGITIEEYETRLSQQDGVCAICGRTPEESGLKVGRVGPTLNVDHDHSCCPGKTTCGNCIRGLVCVYCNRALGFVDKVGFDNLVAYLNR